MRMKFIALLAALVLLPAVLFAVPVVVTWEWLLEDPMVTTFRYQVDGEDDDKWTVVDSSVTSYTERGLDGTLAHTLYLQQSYDGVHFSGSAISVAEPMFPAIEEMPVLAEEPAIVAEPEVLAPVAEEIPVVVAEEEIAPVAETEAVVPVAEEVVVAEEVAPVAEEVIAAEEVVPVAEEVIAAEEVVAAEEPVMVAEEVAAPVETAPVEPVVATQPEPVVAPVEPVELPKAKADSRFYTTISLGGTANFLNTTIGGYNDINLQAGVGIQLNNLMTFNKTLGLGVDMELMYSPYNKGGWGDLLKFQFSNIINNLNHAATISIAPMLNMEFGKVAFDLGVGGFFTYGPSLATTDGDSMLYGAFAKAALEYKFNKSFSLGASGKYGFILSEGSLSSAPQFAEGSVYMGFSF